MAEVIDQRKLREFMKAGWSYSRDMSCYSHIEDFTMAEDAWFVRSAEPDGTPYKFKKFLVILETTGAGPDFNIQFQHNGTIISQNWVYAKSNANASKLSVYMEADIENGIIRVTASNTWLEGVSAYLTNSYVRDVGDVFIDRLGFSKMLPAGMTVKIYGVRA